MLLFVLHTGAEGTGAPGAKADVVIVGSACGACAVTSAGAGAWFLVLLVPQLLLVLVLLPVRRALKEELLSVVVVGCEMSRHC